ncbi:MAG: hypothetical protein NTY97_03205, partial [Planctomycetota bacterium]|nr:hypothetical protein [Planctomycetota bacterium]
CLAMMCALLAAFFSTPTARAADVEPLRSADLEARLTSAGFDDAQRAKILADYAAYVQRYSTSVAALIIEWQGLAGVQPSSIEEARTRQSKGRAAAQAIDDAERPLLDAIRGAARTDQTAAVNQLLMLLEIRRDLAFSSTLRDGMFARKAVDIFEVVDGANLSTEKLALLKPFLDQYLVERQAIVRRLRDATLNVPLRRFDAKQKHPLPTQPQADPNSPDPKQFQADIQAWFQAQETVSEAIMEEALAERSAARTKSIELDLRTIDSMMPLLSGREQAKLLAQWKNDAGSFFQTSDHGPSKLSRAWTTSPSLITPEVATQLDAICANWVTEWWPSAKESALVTTNGNQFAMFSTAVNDDGSEKADKGAAATDRAAAAIAALLDPKGDSKQDPKKVVTSKPGIRLQEAQEDVQIVGAEQGQGGQEVQAVFSTVMVVGDPGDAGGMAFNLEGMEFEGIEMQGGGFMIEGDAMGMGEGVTIELGGGAGGFSRPNPLPKLMRFEDIKPVLAAAGVDETMMAVSETAIDDLLSDAREITEAAKASQTGSSMMPDGMFEQGPDGSIKLVDPAVRAQRVADREALRAELLALETSKLDEILPSVVPEAGRPVVSWLTAWRQLESERAAASVSGDIFSSRSQHDPVQSVFTSKLSSSDWKAVGPELTAVCADLASRTHAYVTASSKAQAASPLPQFAEQNGGAIQQGQAVMADGNMEGFMKLQQEAQRANKAAQTAANDAIPRLKSRISPEAAQRLQDAWDDQLYSRDLKDATDLSDRFDSALAMVLTDPVRQQVIALQTNWRAASRLIRDRIVAVKSKPTHDVIAVEDAAKAAIARRERTAELTAIKFERDEQNRRVFRELSAALGADLAAKLAPLPESKKRKVGGGIGSMMGGASFTIPSPPLENPSPK